MHSNKDYKQTTDLEITMVFNLNRVKWTSLIQSEQEKWTLRLKNVAFCIILYFICIQQCLLQNIFFLKCIDTLYYNLVSLQSRYTKAEHYTTINSNLNWENFVENDLICIFCTSDIILHAGTFLLSKGDRENQTPLSTG